MTASTRSGIDFAVLLNQAADAVPAKLPSADPAIVEAISELLDRIGDGFNDHTQERWFLASDGWHLWMHDSPNNPNPRSDWTAAVALARHLLGEPAPQREIR